MPLVYQPGTLFSARCWSTSARGSLYGWCYHSLIGEIIVFKIWVCYVGRRPSDAVVTSRGALALSPSSSEWQQEQNRPTLADATFAPVALAGRLAAPRHALARPRQTARPAALASYLPVWLSSRCALPRGLRGHILDLRGHSVTWSTRWRHFGSSARLSHWSTAHPPRLFSPPHRRARWGDRGGSARHGWRGGRASRFSHGLPRWRRSTAGAMCVFADGAR